MTGNVSSRLNSQLQVDRDSGKSVGFSTFWLKGKQWQEILIPDSTFNFFQYVVCAIDRKIRFLKFVVLYNK